MGLTGITVVELAFHFLPTPADVLHAATTCRRWRDLACADSVWRARFEREGLADMACLFEVALPAEGGAGGGGGGSGSSSSGGGGAGRDEMAGVGLAFYAQVFALKVGNANSAQVYYAPRRVLGRALARPVSASPPLVAAAALPPPPRRGTR